MGEINGSEVICSLLNPGNTNFEVSLTNGNGLVKFLTNNEGGGDLIAVLSDSCDPHGL